MTREPCRHCGGETAAGSRRFPGRITVVGEVAEYVCPVCADEHPLRDENGIVLSRERLAALSYVVHHDRGGSLG